MTTYTKDNHSYEEQNFPRFLVVASKDGQPIKLSIFGIQKILECAVGEVKEAKKIRNGNVLIEVYMKSQANNALAMHTWVDQSIVVTPHRSLNTSRGVIRCREFYDCDDAEVLEALSPQGVTEVKRIISKRNGMLEKTHTFVVTFGMPSAPKAIKAAYMKLTVDPYVPSPSVDGQVFQLSEVWSRKGQL